MNLAEILLTAVGLSMDAFAVAVTDGLCCSNLKKQQTIQIGLCFGMFQGVMPLTGFFLGKAFESCITAVDHYVALILLGYIGIKMILDAVQESGQDTPEIYELTPKLLILQGIATSIDALAVGVSFAVLANVNIFCAVAEIAVITCLLSLTGVRFGRKFGRKLGNRALLTGGVILVCLGIKIFIEHVFFH
ncbi:MAG: manganese efflux pump [Oscillospiraceae bacterium]|nr:manganese efflux pump [Oscillospiraceae bacterium]